MRATVKRDRCASLTYRVILMTFKYAWLKPTENMWLLYHLVMLKLAAWCYQPISDLCIAICEFWKYVAFFILHCIVKHMMTSSNGNIFRVTDHLCREFTGPVISPHTSFDVFFVLRLNKRLSKQSWGSWFETLSHPSWRHRNDLAIPRQSASGTQHYPEYWKQIRSPIKCVTEPKYMLWQDEPDNNT